MSGSKFERENIVTDALPAAPVSKPAEPAREHAERVCRGQLEQRRARRQPDPRRAGKLQPRRIVVEVALAERRRRAVSPR